MVKDDAKLQRVCVSTWSFHTSFESDTNNPAKVLMDIRDFPEMVADRYHVHNVEIVLPHLQPAEPSLIRDFKARLGKEGAAASGALRILVRQGLLVEQNGAYRPSDGPADHR